MILPYMSIDLFFIAAPFLCRTQEELRIFSRRVIAAILIAGLCFLLFPLRFAFPRPHANGWLGAVFDWFRGVDVPYNLFPSLARRAARCSWSMFTREIFAAFCSCGNDVVVRSLSLSRHCLLTSTTSSTSSVVLSWPDIASTFSVSLPTLRQLLRIAASVRITQPEQLLSWLWAQSFGHGESCSFGQRSLSASWRSRTSERVRSFFTRLKESCRGARGLCWRLVYSVNICRCCITGANVDRGTRSHHKSGLAANWDAVPRTKLCAPGLSPCLI